MPEIEHHCVETVAHSRVTVSERGKKITFLNPDRMDFQKIKVDGCLVTVGPRADWIVTKVGIASTVVELKGRDVRHAIDQLFATIDSAACAGWLVRPTKLLVICSKFPAFDTQIAKAQVRAKKKGMTLKIVCKSFECQMEQL